MSSPWLPAHRVSGRRVPWVGGASGPTLFLSPGTVLQALAPLNPAPLMRCFYTIMGQARGGRAGGPSTRPLSHPLPPPPPPLCFQGGASDKVMFYFFWVNSFAAAVTYYRLAQERRQLVHEVTTRASGSHRTRLPVGNEAWPIRRPPAETGVESEK